MKWQQFLELVAVLAAAVLLVWRSSGKKPHGYGCKCSCVHESEGEPRKQDAVR